MAGPALTQVPSHRAIHDAAFGEVEGAGAWACVLWDSEEDQRMLDALNALLVKMAARILNHTQEEEPGLFIERMRGDPGYRARTDALVA